MKIVFLTDSYGGPRVVSNVVDVRKEQTYPELVKSVLEAAGHSVVIDYLSFRKVTELPALMRNYPDADVYILQAGVVDVYPRVISHRMTLSQSFYAKAIRRIIRMRRSFFIRYVRSISWSSEPELVQAIRSLCSMTACRLVWINVAPVNHRMDRDTPGANAAIRRYNELLSRLVAHSPNCSLVDVFGLLSSKADFERFLHPEDSHLNVEGNRLYAELILEHLRKQNLK